MGQLTTKDNARKIALCCVTGRGTMSTVLPCAILAIIGILSLGDDLGSPFLALKTMLAETGPVQRMTMNEYGDKAPMQTLAGNTQIDRLIDKHVEQLNGVRYFRGLPPVDLRTGTYDLNNNYLPSAESSMSFDEESVGTAHFAQSTRGQSDRGSNQSLLSDNLYPNSPSSPTDSDLVHWNARQGSGALWNKIQKRKRLVDEWPLKPGQDPRSLDQIARDERHDRCATRSLTVCTVISCLGIAYVIGSFIYQYIIPSS